MSPRSLRALDTHPVSELRAVSPRKVAGLHALEVDTVLQLLMHYPRRYVDRTRASKIDELAEGAEAVVTADVVRSTTRRPRRGRSMAEVVLRDETGTLHCTFFNQAWQAGKFAVGQRVTAIGKVRTYRGQVQMANPQIDLVGDQSGRIVAIYPQSGKANVSSVDLAAYVKEALERSGELEEPVARRYLDELGLVSRTEAMRAVHRPEHMADKDRARTRLAFDELLRLQLLLVRRKRAAISTSTGISHDTSAGGLATRFVERLPFELTGAQRRAIREIARDLAEPHPMNRLLQGDVGSGKTVVAVAAMLYAVQGGHQGAFMAPTEVLAEQHYLSVRSLVEELSVPDDRRLGGERPLAVELLTSRTTAAERARLLADLASGRLDLIVGTHALLSGDVAFASLGVAVVDEQHRFGVEQRAALREKGSAEPDLLVMTATPIPRTAAMTVYGDLDHATLDEMPPGRTPVTTRLVSWSQQAAVWKRVRAELDAGRQAYVVCPLIGGGALEEEGLEEGLEVFEDPYDDEEDGQARFSVEEPSGERPPARSAVEEHDRLAREFEGVEVGLLHGQMSSKDKEAVMAAFRDNQIQLLVATTVVEVGVDVANATVMVVEDADRFGIAQLHQLRGRVGRGRHRSYCFLVADPVSDLAADRLQALVRTQNGFELAEEDLHLRGSGTVLGARQKGRSDLKLASLRLHKELVMDARRVALDIVEGDPELAEDLNRRLWEEVELFVSEEERQFLFRS